MTVAVSKSSSGTCSLSSVLRDACAHAVKWDLECCPAYECDVDASEGCVLIATCLAVLRAQKWPCPGDRLSIVCLARSPAGPDILISLPPLPAQWRDNVGVGLGRRVTRLVRRPDCWEGELLPLCGMRPRYSCPSSQSEGLLSDCVWRGLVLLCLVLRGRRVRI